MVSVKSEGSRSVDRMTGDGKKADPARRFVSPSKDRRSVDLPDPTVRVTRQQQVAELQEVGADNGVDSPGPSTMLN